MPRFLDCGESGLLAAFDTGETTPGRIAALGEALAAHFHGAVETVPAMTSLTVLYDPFSIAREVLIAAILEEWVRGQVLASEGRELSIPVIYGGPDTDLADIAALAGLSLEEAAALHASVVYDVVMLGFLPGFAYMAEVPELLRLPRRSTPRSAVPAGAVAIAAGMTAIYPLRSPGGWHVVGHTTVSLWDLQREDRPLLRPGDRVRFHAMNAETDKARSLSTDAAA